MTEYIKREDAINAIKKWEYINAEGYKNYVGKVDNLAKVFNTYMTAHRLDIELIEKLPVSSVDQEEQRAILYMRQEKYQEAEKLWERRVLEGTQPPTR